MNSGLPMMEYPTFEVEVPSTKEKVKFRPFLVKEHKVLMMMESDSADEVASVLESLIDVCTFGALKGKHLSEFDIEYLYLAIRSKTVGEFSNVLVPCRSCEHKNTTAMDLNRVRVDRTEGHSNKFDLGKDVNGNVVGVVMNYPKLAKVLSTLDSENANEVFDMIAESMQTIFTDDAVFPAKNFTKEQLLAFLESLNADQLEQFETFFRTMPKVVQEIDFKCEKCGQDNHYVVTGLDNFFV